MARPRQPIELVIANGRKNLTKQEIHDRTESEVKPCTDEIAAPSYLTATQKKTFNKIAGQLEKLGIMGETDCEMLARYITAQSLYEQAVKDLRAISKERPEDMENVEALAHWAEMLDKLDKRVDRYFKQATAAASKLGLSITDRCKLVVPAAPEPPKVNKFSKFEGAGSA